MDKTISIRAPLAGSDYTDNKLLEINFQFQSALPLRGATSGRQQDERVRDFNPRSPCGERQRLGHRRNDEHAISIRAPLAGSDGQMAARGAEGARFQSALPLRGATQSLASSTIPAGNFNPRSPCGERRG